MPAEPPIQAQATKIDELLRIACEKAEARKAAATLGLRVGQRFECEGFGSPLEIARVVPWPAALGEARIRLNCYTVFEVLRGRPRCVILLTIRRDGEVLRDQLGRKLIFFEEGAAS